MLGADEVVKAANWHPISAPFLCEVLNKVLAASIGLQGTRNIHRKNIKNHNDIIAYNSLFATIQKIKYIR